MRLKNAPYIATDAKKKMMSAASYINLNYSDKELSVASLSERFSMSEVYFRKLFKSYARCSPIEYITAVRLKNAQLLLRYDFVTLQECAMQCGFSSVQYFTRAFKKKYNTTPAEYRKSFLQKSNI